MTTANVSVANGIVEIQEKQAQINNACSTSISTLILYRFDDTNRYIRTLCRVLKANVKSISYVNKNYGPNALQPVLLIIKGNV